MKPVSHDKPNHACGIAANPVIMSSAELWTSEKYTTEMLSVCGDMRLYFLSAPRKIKV